MMDSYTVGYYYIEAPGKIQVFNYDKVEYLGEEELFGVYGIGTVVFHCKRCRARVNGTVGTLYKWHPNYPRGWLFEAE